VLSTLAAAMILVTETETWSSSNYKSMLQARYAAEAGAQNTLNYLLYTYPAPTNMAAFDLTKYPVQDAATHNPIILSAMTGVTGNYPTASVQTAFSSALKDASVPGVGVPTSYEVTATLLSMTSAGASWLGTGGAMQTWQITSQGNVAGVRNAQVQVVMNIERTGTPVFSYAVAATSTACAAVKFGGTDFTDSYNSSNGTYVATAQASGGDIATNGNVTLGSAAKINGTIYDDNTTVGACPNGITVATASPAQFTASVTKPANFLTLPLPWGCTTNTVLSPCYPVPSPSTTAQNISTACASITGCTSNGTTSLYDNNSLTTMPKVFTVVPGSYGNLEIDNADVVHLTAGTYNINSLNFAKDGQLVIDSGPVVFNVAGKGFCASGCTSSVVINSGGLSGWNLCANGGTANVGTYTTASCGGASKTAVSGVAANLQIVYAGTATVSTTGAPLVSAIYAPNAFVDTTGAAVGMYGSIISGTFAEASKAPVHYDKALATSVLQPGPYNPISFSWSKF
jgi:hypothetical protein